MNTMTTPKTPTPTPRTDAEASDGWTGDAICVSDYLSQAIERDLSGFCAVLGHPITPDDTADSASSKVVLAMADLQAVKREAAVLKEQLNRQDEAVKSALAAWTQQEHEAATRAGCVKVVKRCGSIALDCWLTPNKDECATPLVALEITIVELREQLRQKDYALKAANELRVSGGDTCKSGIVRAFVEFPAGTPIRVVGTFGQCLAAHRARTGGK